MNVILLNLTGVIMNVQRINHELPRDAFLTQVASVPEERGHQVETHHDTNRDIHNDTNKDKTKI